MKKYILIILAVNIIFSCNKKTKADASNDNSQHTNPHELLTKAIEENNIVDFNKYIDEIKDINEWFKVDNEFGYYTLIGYASRHNRCSIVDKLISKGADIETAYYYDGSICKYDALYVAIDYESVCTTELLLTNGANPNRLYSEQGLYSLAISCKIGNYEISKMLLEYGANVDGFSNKDGDNLYSVIFEAVYNGNSDFVKLLIDYGCDLYISNKYNQTPLEIAQLNNNTEIENLILTALQNPKNKIDKKWLGEYSLLINHEEEGTTKYNISISKNNCIFTGHTDTDFNWKCKPVENNDTLYLIYANTLSHNKDTVAKIFVEAESYYFVSEIIAKDNNLPYNSKIKLDKTSGNILPFEKFTPETLSDFKYKDFYIDESYKIYNLSLLFGYYENESKQNTEFDYGKRLVCFDKDNKKIFQSKGSGDTWIFRPSFFISPDKEEIVIMCQLGFEYFYGAECFLLKNNILNNMGMIEVEPYSESVEEYSNDPVTDVTEIKYNNNKLEFTFNADTLIFDHGGENSRIIENSNFIYIYKDGKLEMSES